MRGVLVIAIATLLATPTAAADPQSPFDCVGLEASGLAPTFVQSVLRLEVPPELIDSLIEVSTGEVCVGVREVFAILGESSGSGFQFMQPIDYPGTGPNVKLASSHGDLGVILILGPDDAYFTGYRGTDDPKS